MYILWYVHVCEIDMNAVQCVHVYLLPLVYCIHIRRKKKKTRVTQRLFMKRLMHSKSLLIDNLKRLTCLSNHSEEARSVRTVSQASLVSSQDWRGAAWRDPSSPQSNPSSWSPGLPSTRRKRSTEATFTRRAPKCLTFGRKNGVCWNTASLPTTSELPYPPHLIYTVFQLSIFASHRTPDDIEGNSLVLLGYSIESVQEKRAYVFKLTSDCNTKDLYFAADNEEEFLEWWNRWVFQKHNTYSNCCWKSQFYLSIWDDLTNPALLGCMWW